MPDETTVSSADIARLAAVGRPAVSNWRRRYPDFPQPVAGTPASPLFALAAVEAWLRGQGKLAEVPLAEQAWQELRVCAGDDLSLAGALADTGSLLATGRPGAPEAVAALAAALGPAGAFEVLMRRFQETQARRVPVTPPETAELMAVLAGAAHTVLDPACGTGDLLLAARGHHASRLFGQDAAADTARIAQARLRLCGSDAIVRPEDSLRRDAFPGVLADAVLCDPPFHDRSWGHDELTADPRWVYGLPPGPEPELAWVQHALAHLTVGGLAVVLMPAAAAGRRPGRRIRAQLLRRGALRCLVALSPSHHLWLLRRPSADMPGKVLLISSADPDTVTGEWQHFHGGGARDVAGVSRAVPVIDLLDDEVDLTPARHLPALALEGVAEAYLQTRERYEALAGALHAPAPDLRLSHRPQDVQGIPVTELARIGYLEIRPVPARNDLSGGERAVITAEDIVAGRPASGQGIPDGQAAGSLPGDIAVAVVAGHFAARVLDDGGILPGPGVTLLRVDQQRLDPHFVAGTLCSSANTAASVVQTGGTARADVRRARIPGLPLPEQRRYGEAFRRMDGLRSAIRSAGEAATELAQLMADGVAGGMLELPGGEAMSGQSRLGSGTVVAAAGRTRWSSTRSWPAATRW